MQKKFLTAEFASLSLPILSILFQLSWGEGTAKTNPMLFRGFSELLAKFSASQLL